MSNTIGHMLKVMTAMNNQYLHIFKLFLISAVLCGGFSLNVYSQTLDESELLNVLEELKKSRSETSYFGVLEIRYGPEKPRSALYNVWSKPPSIYFMERKLTGKNKRKKGGRQFQQRQHTRRHSYQHESSEFSLFPRRKYLDLFLKNYRVEKNIGEVQAGRKTFMLDLKPIHLPSFGMRLWYDESNHFILKREIVYFGDEDELTTMRHEFKEIQFDISFPDSILAKASKKSDNRRRTRKKPGQRFETLTELKKNTDATPFVPKNLPDGFELTSIGFNKEAGRNITHLHYTNGLLNLSIFEIKGPLPKSFGRLLKSPTNRRVKNYSFRQMVVKKVDPYSFLLIGNFPRQQMQKIADSLQN